MDHLELQGGAKAPSKRAVAAAARPLADAELAGIAQAQRDQTLQLFHVLGKVLYNKRDAAAGGAEGEEEERGGDDEGGPSTSSWSGGGGGRRTAGGGVSAAARARREAAARVKEQQARAGTTGSRAGGLWLSLVSEMSAKTFLPERSEFGCSVSYSNMHPWCMIE